MNTTSLLREFWLKELERLPRDCPLYVEAMASRIAILCEDIEELLKKSSNET